MPPKQTTVPAKHPRDGTIDEIKVFLTKPDQGKAFYQKLFD